MDRGKIVETLSIRQVNGSSIPLEPPFRWSLRKPSEMTDEIWVTNLIIIENILKGRSLTYLSDDPVSSQVLTPKPLPRRPCQP